MTRTDTQKRRLYRRSEFDPDNGKQIEGDAYCANIRRRSLILDDDVIEWATGKKVALSKTAFADLVAKGAPPFESVSFDGFRGVFEALQQIGRSD